MSARDLSVIISFQTGQGVSLEASAQVNIKFLNKVLVPAVREFLEAVEHKLVLPQCPRAYVLRMRVQEVLHAVGESGTVYSGILRACFPGTLEGLSGHPIAHSDGLARITFSGGCSGNPYGAVADVVLPDRAALHCWLKFLEGSPEFFRAGGGVIPIDSKHGQAYHLDIQMSKSFFLVSK